MDDVRGQLTPYLLAGEVLVWSGRPDPAKHVSGHDVFLIPFSLLWGGFAIFWMVSALTQGAPVPFVLFGIPFVLMGVYMIAGRFVHKAHSKRQTAYGLTEGRAIVATRSGMSEAPLQHTPLDQKRSRSGRHLTVTFGRQARSWPAGPSYANTGMEFFDRGSGPLAFYDVPDVEGLERALRAVRR